LNGHWDVVRWLRRQGCQLYDGVFAAAAQRGDMEAMAWLRRKDCPWSQWAALCAIKYGKFDALRWLHRKGCPIPPNAVLVALEAGHIHMLDWLGDEVGLTLDGIDQARIATLDHVTSLRWVYERSPERVNSPHVLCNLALFADVATMRWARDVVGCPLHADVWRMAARGGNIAVLEWLGTQHDLAHAPRAGVCVEAAHNGQLTALRWLHARGFALSPQVFRAAVECGHMDMLRWLRVRACRWAPVSCIAVAVANERPRLERWLRERYDDELTSGRAHLHSGTSTRGLRRHNQDGSDTDTDAEEGREDSERATTDDEDDADNDEADHDWRWPDVAVVVVADEPNVAA
jgi:hypothetical protein